MSLSSYYLLMYRYDIYIPKKKQKVTKRRRSFLPTFNSLKAIPYLKDIEISYILGQY